MNRRRILIKFIVMSIILSVIVAIAQHKPVTAKPKSTETGKILAGAYVYCTNSGSLIRRSFNKVNDQPITISDGATLGVCTVDFGFDVSERYIIATVTHPTTPLGVTVAAPPFSGSTVKLFVYHGGNILPVAGGDVFIIVY